MALTLPNILVLVITTYYTIYIIFMLNSKKRKNIAKKNIKLTELRNKKIKSLKDQKAFLDLRYPKKQKFKITFGGVGRFLLNILVFMLFFRGYKYLLDYSGINFKLWHAILILMLLPMFMNIILEKFNLQKNDLRVFFK